MKRRSILLAMVTAALLLGATLVTANEPEARVWLPENVSASGGRDVDTLFYVILGITGVALIGVEAFLIYYLVRYRHRDGVKAHYTHGNNRIEVIWTLIPTAILVILAIMNQNIWAKLKSDVPEDAFPVRVSGKQFNWLVTYPGPDGEYDTADDVDGIDLIRVPAGRPVHLKLTAEDVLHSFFLPNLRFKRDAVPGLVSDLWFEVDTPGRYEIACAEFCGFGHYTMGGYLMALEQSELDSWLNEQYGTAAAGAGSP